MNQAELILFSVKVWGWIGMAIALPFLTFGIDQVDEDARGAYVFRLLLIPGILVIWPLVLWRWYKLMAGTDAWSPRYRPRRKAHQWIAVTMAVAIVVVMVVGLSIRQTWPSNIEPVRLSPPAEISE